MPNSPTKKTVYINFNKKDLEVFERQYPKLLKIFIERAVITACNHRDVFEACFFNEEIKHEFSYYEQI